MRFLLLVLLLAAAAVIVDDPSRWQQGYGLLRHAEWDGVLAADLVTPVFLFFLGAAIPLGGRALRTPAFFAIAAALCAAGLALNGVWRSDPATWRITGVLQRAGVTLCIAAGANALVAGDYRRRVAALTSAAVFITVTYWLVMAHVAAPGGAPGDLLPSDNPAAWLDRIVLGRHAWSEQWDPDGILSTLSSASTVLAGLSAGILLTSDRRRLRPALELAGAGGAAMIAGLVWTLMVAMNRTLWSASFVVFSAGVGALLLAGVIGVGGVNGERR
jgi:predicted acyltransferase